MLKYLFKTLEHYKQPYVLFYIVTHDNKIWQLIGYQEHDTYKILKED